MFLSGTLAFGDDPKRDYARAILRNQRISVARAADFTNDVFVKAIVNQFEAVQLAELAKTGVTFGKIGRLFGVHKGTVSKWIRGEQRVAWEKVCLSYARFDVQFTAHFPRGRHITREALRCCIESFAGHFLKANTNVKLTTHELVLLHYGCLNVDFLQSLCLLKQQAPAENWLAAEKRASAVFERAMTEEDAVRHLLDRTERFPQAFLLSRVIRRWHEAWYATLLVLGLSYDWKYEDEPI